MGAPVGEPGSPGDRPSELESELSEILADQVSGATEIERRLLQALSSAALSEAARLVVTLPERLRAAVPQMANMLDLASELSGLLHVSESARPKALRELADDRLAELRRRGERLSSAVGPLLPEGDLLVFTLSKSGTVSAVLDDLHAAGRRLAVLVAESRPGGEGSRLARELGEKGIRSRACDDFLLLSLVPQDAAGRRPPGYVGSPVVLVGADAVHPDALVNKVGTRALLQTARLAGVPALVLASSSKMRGEPAPRVLGSLFETIPRGEVSVVTEKGPV